MFSLRLLTLVAAAGLALAGCGGGASTGPVPTSQADSHGRQVQSLQAAGTLYVADISHVYAYDLMASDPATVQRTVTPHPKTINSELIQGIATGSDGTLAILQNYFDQSNNEYCRIVVFPSNADTGTLANANYYCDPIVVTQGESIARSPSGWDIVYRKNLGPSTYQVQRLGYNGTVNSTLALPSGIWNQIAVTSAGNDFVSDLAGHVQKWPGSATGPGGSTETITVPNTVEPKIWALAEAPDKTLYVAAGMFGTSSNSYAGNEYVFAYPGGSTSPARAIGPFTNNYITALAVDASGELYVATNSDQAPGQTRHNRIQVFAADANGKDAPVRSITNPISMYAEIKGLAIYQPPSAAL
jgi:hypothetical protein